MAPTRKHSNSKSAWKAACLMVAAACLLGSASAGRITRLGPGRPVKQVWTASPGNLSATTSSCTWTGYECGATMAPIFAKSAPLISSDNYPARARAFNAASDLFCSQFSENQCSYPCQYNTGVGCQVNGDAYYQIFDCPGSVLYEERTCSGPQLQTPAACLSAPSCSYTTSPTEPDEVCTSTYASTLTPNQYFDVFLQLQFGLMPKQLMGCCKGSVYKYQLANWCDAAFNNVTGNTTPEACAKVPGCIWDPTTPEFCVPSPQTDVKLQFAYKPADPVAPVLSKLGGECRAIKDQATCNAYKPVKVDAQKVKAYMGLSQRLNTPIADKQCPLPSVQLPNM